MGLLLLAGCGEDKTNGTRSKKGERNEPKQKVETAAHEAQQNQKHTTGKKLYVRHCASCHGMDLTGNPPDIPSLKNLGRRSPSFIRMRIRNGKGMMPAFSFLSKNERSAIVDYLFGSNTAVAKRTEPDPETRGKQLFESNCARCHRATTNDPPPSGIPSEHPMTPAPMAGVTKRFSRKKFDQILNRGPGMMPGYPHLGGRDRDALWAYFKTLEGKGEPEGDTMLERHPGMMSERHPGTGGPEQSTNPSFTMDDISKAIRRYIDTSMHLNDGYVAVEDQQTGEVLELTELVRVHDDRLSKVRPDRFFACVDMRSRDDTLYDIDFFLEPMGDRLHVTKSLVHKVGETLRFRWVQEDGFWKRKPVKENSDSK